jgi:hypothetical protein
LLVVSLAAIAALAHVCATSRAQEGAKGAAGADAKEPEAKSVIYGRAVYEETGRPVRRARIHLQSTNAFSHEGAEYAQQRGALTNANGEFRIENVAAGSYLIYVEAPGVLTPSSFTEYDGAMGNEDLDAIYKNFAEVKVDGKDRREVAVRAHLGAAIGGRVTYSDGDAVPGAQVSVLRHHEGRNARLGGGARGQFSVTSTDERGRFRVSALPPGDYLVVVSELIAHGDSSGERATASPLVLTYHPSETKAEKAAIVTLEAGDQREDVDITIAERETHAIAGVVRGRRDGRPIENATVSFRSRDAEAGGFVNPYPGYNYGPNSISTDEQGRWRFDDMPDGEYTIEVSPPSEDVVAIDEEGEGAEGEDPAATPTPVPAPTPPKKLYAPARRTLTVAGGDLTDVVVALGDAVRITGKIMVEGGGQLPENRYVMATLGEGQDERPPYFFASMNENEFTIEGIPPGKYTLYANFYTTEKNDFFVKSATWRGHDLLRERLEIKEGEAVEGVSILFSAGRAEVRLRLYASADKTPARGVHVVLAPVDQSQRYRTDLPYCYTDRDGACTLGGAPGDYALLTYNADERPNVYNEQEAQRLIAAAPRVSLRPGKPASFELVVPGGH